MGLKSIYRSSAIGRFADWTSLGQLAFTIAGLCGGGALLTWAASSIDFISQHGWGAVVFAGLGGACGLILTLSVAAFAVRACFPARTLAVPTQTAVAEAGTGHGDQIIQWISEIQNNVVVQSQYSQNNFDDINQKLGAVSQRIGEIRERLSGLDKLLEPSSKFTNLQSLGMPNSPPVNRLESIDASIDGLHDRIASFERSIKEMSEDYSQRINKLNEDTYDSLANIRKAIYAQRTFESYNNLTKEIDEISLQMDDPLSKPELYSDWQNWDADFLRFKSMLRNLEVFVAHNASITTNFFDTPPEKYISERWRYDFGAMSDDQKMNYKTFKLILINFNDNRTGIRSTIYNSTFPKA